MPPAPLGLAALLSVYAVAAVGGDLAVAVAMVPTGAVDSAWTPAIALSYALPSACLLLACLAALHFAPHGRQPRWTWPGAALAALSVAIGVSLKLVGDGLAAVEHGLIGPLRGNNPLILHPHAFTQAGQQAVLAIAIVGIAPVAEEIFFRGLLYGWLRARLGPLSSAPIAAVLFAAAHHNLSLLLPLSAVGLGLCLIYERTGSLWPPILAHAAVNACSLALALLVA